MHDTLLLNAGFEPLHVISWQRAFVLIFQEKVEVLEQYRSAIHTVSMSFPVPAVVRLKRWVSLRRPVPVVRFSRANVYARDNYQCQYCYQRFTERELTLDHIKPVVRGGKKTWENIVAACMRCNQRKSDRTLEEVGFKLLRIPHVPRWLPGVAGNIRTRSTPEIWEPYLESLIKKGSGVR